MLMKVTEIALLKVKTTSQMSGNSAQRISSGVHDLELKFSHRMTLGKSSKFTSKPQFLTRTYNYSMEKRTLAGFGVEAL